MSMTGGDAMKWSTEQKVRDAIRFGDGELLAEAVKDDRFLDYDELEQFVGEQVGGYRHVSWRGVQVGATTVVDKFGRPLVTGALILAMAAAAVLNTGRAAAQCTPECSQVPEPAVRFSQVWLPVVAVDSMDVVAERVLEEGPILGPGPCSSDTPHFCYAHQLYLPGVAK